jgi:hypothetical protein
MKTFLFFVSSDDQWEICGSIYLVNAESKEEAESIFEMEESDWNTRERSITDIQEIDQSVKGQIRIQEYVIE